MSDPDLRQLVRGARALLIPSFDEGFGLPLAEALIDGTPAVASDIDVLRQTAQGKAIFRDPIDGPGWLQAIRELSHADSHLAREAKVLVGTYSPISTSSYFSRVEAFLDTL